jgi:TolA-binding protein
VPEALYRIAESYQNEAALPEAVAAFQAVIDQFGESTWAPWSMLRQGECFATLGKKSEARLFWEDVIRKYPKSKAAKEAKTLLGR